MKFFVTITKKCIYMNVPPLLSKMGLPALSNVKICNKLSALKNLTDKEQRLTRTKLNGYSIYQ